LISVIPTLIGVTLVIFLFQRLIPGDPAVAMLGEHATEEMSPEYASNSG
jgi:peptide/nickel transport system permease protein